MEQFFIYFFLIILISFLSFLLLSIVYPHILLVWIMDHYIKSNKGDKINKLLRTWKISISLGSLFEPFVTYVIRKSKHKVLCVSHLIDLNYKINIKGSLYYAIISKEKELIKLLLDKGNVDLLEFDSLGFLLTRDEDFINYTMDSYISIKQNTGIKELLIKEIFNENSSYDIFNNEQMFHTFFIELTNSILLGIKPPYDLFVKLSRSITLEKEIKYIVKLCSKSNLFHLLMKLLNDHHQNGKLIKDLTVEETTITLTYSDERSINYSYSLDELIEYITSFKDEKSWDGFHSSLLGAYKDSNEFIVHKLLPLIETDNLSSLLTLAIVNDWNDYLISIILNDTSFNEKLETLIIDYLQNKSMQESISHMNRITSLCINYFNNESNIKEVIELVLNSKISQIKNKILDDNKYYEAYEKVNENELYINDIECMSEIEFENYLNIVYKLLGYKNLKIVSNSSGHKLNFIMEKSGEKFGVLALLSKENIDSLVVKAAVEGGTSYQLDQVMVVTNTTFTQSAIDLAENNHAILVDKAKLRNLLRNVNHERFISHLRFNFPIKKSTLDNDNSVEMSYTYRLIQEAKKGKELSNIIHKGIHDFNIQDEYGKTPLMYAIESKNVKIVKQLLGYDFDINITDLKGRTALHYLFDFKGYFSKEIWNMFIRKGANFYCLDIEKSCIMVLLKEKLTEDEFEKHPAYKVHNSSIYNLEKFKFLYNING